MKVRALILAGLALWASLSCPAQGGPMEVKVFALGRYYCVPDTCELHVMERYGIVVSYGGCIVTNEKLRTNRRACRKLRRRFGANWQDQFSADLLNACGSIRCQLYCCDPLKE